MTTPTTKMTTHDNYEDDDDYRMMTTMRTTTPTTMTITQDDYEDDDDYNND